jgi:hypothetical protein
MLRVDKHSELVEAVSQKRTLVPQVQTTLEAAVDFKDVYTYVVHSGRNML